jgi:hypothetical protein
MGAELFHTDGWADMTKLIVAIRNFVNAPKKSVSPLLIYLVNGLNERGVVQLPSRVFRPLR